MNIKHMIEKLKSINTQKKSSLKQFSSKREKTKQMLNFNRDEMLSILEAINLCKKNYVTNGVIEKNLNEVVRKIQEEIKKNN